MTSLDQAAKQLANLVIASQEPDGPPAAQLGKVISTNPLKIAFDSAQNRTIGIGPVNVSGGVSVAMNDQVLVVWVPSAQAYLCLGKVTGG